MKKPISALLALFLLPALLLCGCSDRQAMPQGENAGILDLRLIDDTVYWLGQTDGIYELFRGDAAEKERIRQFPGAVGIVAFSEAAECYLYASDGVLSAYYPASDRTEELCALQADWILCATDDYVLASTESGRMRIGIGNGSKQALNNMPSKGVRVLDIDGNVVVYWDDSMCAICRYDCDGDSVSVLYRRGRSTSSAMITGLLYNDSLYFSEIQGGFRKISLADDNTADSIVFSKSAIAAARTGTGIVFAVSSASDIVFYLFTGEDEMTEFAVWHGADYAVHGSCLLRAQGNRVVCTVMTQEEIFEAEIQNE